MNMPIAFTIVAFVCFLVLVTQIKRKKPYTIWAIMFFIFLTISFLTSPPKTKNNYTPTLKQSQESVEINLALLRNHP